MRLFVTAFTLCLLAMLSGCVTVSSSSTTVADTGLAAGTATVAPKPRGAPATRDYGAIPGAGARTAIEEYMQRELAEPNGAQYRYINAPVKGSHGGWPDTPLAYGYVVCVWVNARDLGGGYAGEQLNFFLIRNDAVVRASLNANWLCKPYMQ